MTFVKGLHEASAKEGNEILTKEQEGQLIEVVDLLIYEFEQEKMQFGKPNLTRKAKSLQKHTFVVSKPNKQSTKEAQTLINKGFVSFFSLSCQTSSTSMTFINYN